MSQAVALKLEDQNQDFTEEAFENIFQKDVVEGLTASKKSLSPKYFYDEVGSAYFDEICHLDEYYPYRTELKLLPQVASELAERFLKPMSVVEFGAGSLVKIRPLLEAMPNICEFIPIDISGEHLLQAAKQLQRQFPTLKVNPAQADFCHPVALDMFRGERLGFFPGSTIGNFTPEEAQHFLSAALVTLGRNSHLLIGVDTKKSPEVLHQAYNDRKGITAKFNLNMLERINRELDADIDVDKFEHYAYYNPQQGRIEMHLVSSAEQTFQIGASAIELKEGETIHTESSYKYTSDEFKKLAELAGWAVDQTWMAEENKFSMYLLTAAS